ncbi:hypothetical protein WJX84_007699, partial [Apatococcus fuscideae]
VEPNLDGSLDAASASSDPAPDEFDESDDEDDAAAREGPQLSTTQLAWASVGRLLVGITVCAIFSDPLVDALGVFSKASGIPPFFVAFVLTPLGSSAGELISCVRFASKRRQKNISLTFSNIYGSVTMNNSLCLGIFLLIIYSRHLEWVYSSEVTVVVGCTVLVGLLASSRRTFKSIWAVPVIAAYPLSIFAVWWLDKTLGWQ